MDLRYVQTPIRWFLFKGENGTIFPLWTEAIACGYPIHAYGEGGLLYPLNWLIYPFLPIPIAHDVTLMVHIIIAGVGILCWGRKIHENITASLVSAVVFMFSGQMCVHFGHPNSIQVCAWIPWAFLALDANRHILRPASAVWLGLCIALMLLTGGPQITFYALVALTVYAVWSSMSRPWSARLPTILGIGTIIGLLLAAPQVLPTLEFASLSSRSSGMTYEAQLVGTVSWGQLLWIIAPLWDKVDAIGVTSASIGYVGMTTALLLLVSIWKNRIRFSACWWVILFLSLLLSMGDSFPLNVWIYQLPILSCFRGHGQFLFVSTFAASVLAGYSADSLLKMIKDNRQKSLFGIFIVLLVFCDLNYFVRPLVSFFDRRAQEAVPQALSVLSGGGRYLSINTLPIFMHEIEKNKIQPQHYARYFSARETLNDNLGMRYGLQSVWWYTGLQHQRIVDAFSEPTQDLFSQMNCEFVISPGPVAGLSLKEIWRNPFYCIYKNEKVEPRARLVESIVTTKQGLSTKGTIRGSTRILKSVSHQELCLEVISPEAGYLILADTFYPGWRVWVNGEEHEIRRVNGWMRAVSVPAGRTIVDFRYYPGSFFLGLAVAATGILVSIAVVIWHFRRMRNGVRKSGGDRTHIRYETNRLMAVMISIRPFFFLCITVLAFGIVAELASYYAFHHLIPRHLRDGALFVIHGRISEDGIVKEPLIEPYIWSNYRPNPRSAKVNRFGWRYGGTPKSTSFRIFCLGGSTTWSERASSPEKTYPAQLEAYLREKGYDVDVVNGGGPYYSSAELVGTLAFRGIYTESDLIIIHTGGNDIEPLLSPREYRPDYTHWRTVDPELKSLSNNGTFRVLWKFPSWTSRLYLTLRLKPNALYRIWVGIQLTSPESNLLAKTDISHREPVGLKRNLRSLIAISREHGAQPVAVTFNMRYENLHGLVPKLLEASPELRQTVVERTRLSMEKSNEAIRQTCKGLGVPLIPFHEFEPTVPGYWVDQCHLSEEGLREKAEFIGAYLMEHNLLEAAKRTKPMEKRGRY